MHLCGPHCQNPIELADVPASGEVTCAECGSSFNLDPYLTRSEATAAGKRLGKFELLSSVGQGASAASSRRKTPSLTVSWRSRYRFQLPAVRYVGNSFRPARTLPPGSFPR